MSWINNVVPPRIRSLLTTRKDTPENLWVKCPDSGQLVFHKDLESNLFVAPGSDFHMKMDARTRLATTFDEGRWDEIAVGEVLSDPLRFRDEKRYVDKLKEARTNTGLNDAVKLGSGRIGGHAAVVVVQTFDFFAGTVGVAAGEAVVTGAEHALKAGVPFVLFAASGGMRMQEGVFSLMQMPRTTVAVNRLKHARLPTSWC